MIWRGASKPIDDRIIRDYSDLQTQFVVTPNSYHPMQINKFLF
jgi:hypothetical protein